MTDTTIAPAFPITTEDQYAAAQVRMAECVRFANEYREMAIRDKVPLDTHVHAVASQLILQAAIFAHSSNYKTGGRMDEMINDPVEELVRFHFRHRPLQIGRIMEIVQGHRNMPERADWFCDQ